MPVVEVERTYLELRSPAELRAPDREPDFLPPLARLRPVSASTYRVLYRVVGGDWHWRDRVSWPDERLQSHLDRDDVHVWVLGDPSDPDGFFELDRRSDGSVEIAYFGLVSRAMGRGLGAWMLSRAAAEAWAAGADRVWLHTCTLDSPRALPNYLARGFHVFHRERYEAEVFEGP